MTTMKRTITSAAVAGLAVATRDTFNYMTPAGGVRFFSIVRTASRWGERVFEQQNSPPNDPGLGWDGRRGNGEEFPSDVLAWYVELEYYDGRMETRKGDVALLR